MPIFNLFPIQWTYNDEFEGPNEFSIIRIFGLNEKNESVYVKIKDFHIPIWVELPTHIGGRQIIWNDRNVQSLHNIITSWNTNNNYNPSRVEFEMKHKLYYAEVEANTETEQNVKYQKKLFPFLQVYFYNMKAVGFFVKRCNERIKIPGIGEINIKAHCYAPNITPVLKLLASRKLPSSSWIKANGTVMRPKESTKQNEYNVSYLNLMRHPEGDKLPIVYPKVLSFDIEAYSYDPGSMPKASRPTDVVFMIGCVIAQKGKPSKKIMLTCADYSKFASRFDFETVLCKNEGDVYKKFGELICTEDPDIITGYNIFGFDLKYMHDRAKLLSCQNYLTRIGCIPGRKGEFVQKSWESSAYGKQDFMYIESDGRIFLDMFFYVVRAGFKLANYRLETVCSEFLKNQNKDPIKPKDIFRSWDTKEQKLLAAVAKYCVVDSDVVIALYDKLLVWFDLTESASTNGVPLFYLYTQGQQIKMMSQMLSYCIEKNIVVQSKVMEPDPKEQYSGATVTQPIAGLYKMILPFDFASLYPSIIMAYNIDYSKLVNDFPEKNTRIPDEDCHIFKWTEHVNCLGLDSLVNLEHFSVKIKNLQQLKCNSVMTYLEKDQRMTLEKQTKYFDQGHQECMRIYFLDQSWIDCTFDHRFLDENSKWIYAKDITCDMLLKSTYVNTEVDLNMDYAECKEWMQNNFKDSSFDKMLEIMDQVRKMDSIPVDYPKCFLREFLGALFGRNCNVTDRDHECNANMITINYSSITHQILDIFNIKNSTDLECNNIYIHDVVDFYTKIGIRNNPQKTKELYLIVSLSKITNQMDREIFTKDHFNMTKRVTRIEKIGIQPVCDIEVHDTHNFVTNGIVTHNCEHDPEAKKQKLKSGDYKMICKEFNYRFLKADKCDKGVIPTLLENLLGARKATRKVIEKQHDVIMTLEKLLKTGYTSLTEEERKIDIIVKNCDLLESYGVTDTLKKQIEAEIDRLDEVNSVLDKRQLSYKVSANSMYGAMGVRVGYLPFLPGAQTVTYVGRRSIKLASETLQNKWNGTVIYNDTDSAYTYFESLNKLLTDSEGKQKPLEEVMPQVWAYAHTIVEDIANLFPKPMKLEFEDKVYFKFLILTKKRYMGQLCDERGVFGKLRKSGVVLQRRDNCKALRDIYETAVNFLLKNFEEVTSIPRNLTLYQINRLEIFNKFLDTVLEMVNKMFYRVLPDLDFVITRGLTKDNYKDKPPHVCVAEKMIKRGINVPQGARIEYVLLKTTRIYNKDEKQAEKVEDINFFKEFKSFLYLDTLYYLDHQIMNPVDEVIGKVFNWQANMYKNVIEKQRIEGTKKYSYTFKGIPVMLKGVQRSKGFIEEQLEIRINKQKVLCELKALFNPVYEYENYDPETWKPPSVQSN